MTCWYLCICCYAANATPTWPEDAPWYKVPEYVACLVSITISMWSLHWEWCQSSFWKKKIEDGTFLRHDPVWFFDELCGVQLLQGPVASDRPQLLLLLDADQNLVACWAYKVKLFCHWEMDGNCLEAWPVAELCSNVLHHFQAWRFGQRIFAMIPESDCVEVIAACSLSNPRTAFLIA